MPSVNVVPDLQDTKSQLEYDRARALNANRHSSHSSRPFHPRSLSSSSNPHRRAWRRLPPAEAKDRAHPLSGAPNLYDAWDEEVARAHDHGADDYSDNDVPEATWDSSSETEDMEPEPALLSDLITPQTEALDFIMISEYHLAQPAQHFQCPFPSSYPTSPLPHSPPLRDSPLGPGLGLPEDPTVWVEDRCCSSKVNSEGATMDLGKFYSNTVIIIQDSVW